VTNSKFRAKTVPEYRKYYPNAFKAGGMHVYRHVLKRLREFQGKCPVTTESWTTIETLAREFQREYGRIKKSARVSTVRGEGEGQEQG